jgi:hypothetical protein
MYQQKYQRFGWSPMNNDEHYVAARSGTDGLIFVKKDAGAGNIVFSRNDGLERNDVNRVA